MREWILAQVPWNIELLLFLQSQRTPVGDVLFKLITDLGSGAVAVILIVTIWWCVHQELGFDLACMALGTFYVNGMLKNLFQIPRPFGPAWGDLGRPLVPLRLEISYSWPSGHAQNAVAIWGYIACRLRRWWFVLSAGILVILIGFSRLYLGVHTLIDVLGGWGIGVLCLEIGRWMLTRINAGKVWPMSRQVIVWLSALVGMTLLAPFRDAGIVAGMLVGLGLGQMLQVRYVRFSVRGTWWQRMLRPVVGSVILLPIYAGIKSFVLTARWPIPVIGLCLVPAGMAVAWFVPWVFVRLRLAAAL